MSNMELWIRSQDKHTLMKVDYLYSEIKEFDGGFRIYVMPDEIEIAKYKSKERALEVLDEIQNKIKNIYYLKPKCLLDLKSIEAGKHYFEKLNNMEFITTDDSFDIIPFSTNVIIYEMPKE